MTIKQAAALTLALALLLAGCGGPSSSEAPPESLSSPAPPAESVEAPPAEEPPPAEPAGEPVTESGLPAALPGLVPLPTEDGQAVILLDPRSPDEIIDTFCKAIVAGDLDALAVLTPLPRETVNYWKDVRVESASFLPMESAAEWEYLYELTLTVTEPGDTLLLLGQAPYIARVGFVPFGENYLYVNAVALPDGILGGPAPGEDPEIQLIETLRGYGLTDTFYHPSELEREKLLDYIILLSAMDIDRMEMEFTQEEIDATARKYFGLEHFDGRDLRYYVPETERYLLWGRGGSVLKERAVQLIEGEDGVKSVLIEGYTDPFELVVGYRIAYTMHPNGDGSYRFASAVALQSDVINQSAPAYQ